MRTITGKVTSTSMDKTIVVTVETKRQHAKYHKNFKRNKKFYAHDEANACQVGDEVTIQETRPLSRLKRWEVVTD